MLGHEGFGLPLLEAAVCHWAACRGRDTFDTGAGPLRNWRPSGSMGPHAFELRFGLGLDVAASGWLFLSTERSADVEACDFGACPWLFLGWQSNVSL